MLTPALALLLAAAPAWPAPGSFRVAPAPAWVVRAPDGPARPAPPDAVDGLDDLLREDQVRVSAAGVEHYERRVTHVLSARGVAAGSELRIDFDPAYERLAVHEVTLVRGAVRTAALDAREVKLLQRETALERRIYDGTLTAVLILRDVRAGDLIDWSYTVVGQNPVLGGRYADAFPLVHAAPVARRTVRLLAPADRPLAFRVHGLTVKPAEVRRGAEVERRWALVHVPRASPEADVPAELTARPWLQVSEWASWAEVARWAAPLYVAGNTPALEATVAPWRRLPTAEARALAALRFVQEEVRYLGLEPGESGLKPHPPAAVLAQRFGDCKDKSLLLVTLLHALGLRAEVALVHTGWGAAVEQRLPSPFDFDHAVVRLELEGTERWVDPTRTYERGPLAARPPAAFGRALPVRADAADLVDTPPPETALGETATTVAIEQVERPFDVTVETRQVGWGATELRQLLASRPLRDLEAAWLEARARRMPGLQAVGAASVEDDESTGALTVTARYRLPPPADQRLPLTADLVLDALRDPGLSGRRWPLAVAHPARVHERFRVRFPTRPYFRAQREEVVGPAATLVSEVLLDGDSVVVDLDYRSTAGEVPVEGLTRHAEARRRMEGLAAFTIPLQAALLPVSGAADPDGVAHRWWVVGTLAALVAAYWAARLGRASVLRRREAAYRRSFDLARGATPEQPVEVESPGAVSAYVARVPCACGGRCYLPSAEPEATVAHGGRTLAVYVARCPRCCSERRLHFAIGQGAAA